MINLTYKEGCFIEETLDAVLSEDEISEELAFDVRECLRLIRLLNMKEANDKS